jgi:hypothetical protein
MLRTIKFLRRGPRAAQRTQQVQIKSTHKDNLAHGRYTAGSTHECCRDSGVRDLSWGRHGLQGQRSVESALASALY